MLALLNISYDITNYTLLGPIHFSVENVSLNKAN